jgi:hypothetical protein
LREGGREDAPSPAQNTAPWKAGTAVLAGPRNQRGLIKRQVKKGFYAVEIGSVTMTLPETDLRAVRGGETVKTATVPSIQV